MSDWERIIRVGAATILTAAHIVDQLTRDRDRTESDDDNDFDFDDQDDRLMFSGAISNLNGQQSRNNLESYSVVQQESSALSPNEMRAEEIRLHFLDIKRKSLCWSSRDMWADHFLMKEFENLLQNHNTGFNYFKRLENCLNKMLSTPNAISVVIKDDFLDLRKRIQAAINKKSCETSSLNRCSWHHSEICKKNINQFHDREARIPPNIGVRKEDFENKVAMLRKFLEKQGLCKRLDKTGSVYEKVNIAGDIVEFDIMFVADGNWLKVQNAAPGFVYLTPEDNMHNLHSYLDQSGNLDPMRYRDYFKSVIKNWLNIYEKFERNSGTMKLHDHNVAIMMNVFQNRVTAATASSVKPWYQIDLVPCYEINGDLYVPKPDDEDAYIRTWRRSHSIEEREFLRYGSLNNRYKRDDVAQELRRKCVRIVKAIFKCRTEIFKRTYTSYLIKTTMFHFYKRTNIIWSIEDFGSCFMEFFKEIRNCLEKKELLHYFEPEINLLEDLDEVRRIQMVGYMNKLLSKEQYFYSII